MCRIVSACLPVACNARLKALVLRVTASVHLSFDRRRVPEGLKITPFVLRELIAVTTGSRMESWTSTTVNREDDINEYITKLTEEWGRSY
jgi:hypothetical protein